MAMPKGFKHTAETRAKMSESAKARWDIHRHIEEVIRRREDAELNTLRAFSNTAVRARAEADMKRFLEGGK